MLLHHFSLVSLLLLFVTSSCFAQFDNSPFANNKAQTEFLELSEAFILLSEVEQTADEQQLRLNWQIAPEYYLYKHAFKFELVHQGKTLKPTVTIAPGIEKEDDYFGLVETYELNADVDISPLPNKGEVFVKVSSQGCANAGLCYPPHNDYLRVNPESGVIQTITKDEFPIVDSSHSTNENTINGAPKLNKSASQHSLIYILIIAFCGGMILNLMPCVFPVLSLKVLSFSKNQDKAYQHGFAYVMGVVLSFVLVAFILISLRAAGQAIGWGFQLQSAWFVASMAYLFFIMGLNLSGFFEIGGSWMGAGSKLTENNNLSGSFFTGVLATVVACPCTAPFMGTALGYAITQPTSIALLVFAALGFGMAFPLLILTLKPSLLRFIPKPGPWMESFKQFLAFPLYATVIWLCWVAGKQTGVNGMSLIIIGLLLITFAIWVWNNALWRKSIAAIAAALALWILFSPYIMHKTIEHNWQSYSAEKLEELLDNEQKVFINMTADWCITCLGNEKFVLDRSAVKKALEKNNITYLKGDWTNYDSNITAFLAEHGRNGVPLYVFYSGKGEPVVLPQILQKQQVINLFNAVEN